MQTVKCNMGIWNVETQVRRVDDARLLATIFAVAGKGEQAIESKHIVVFDHIPGRDYLEETRTIIQGILRRSH